MPIRKTKPKAPRHQKIAPRPSPPAPTTLPIPQPHTSRPLPSTPPAPAALPVSQPYTPLPPHLTTKMISLIQLSTRIESLSQALSYGLFPTASEQDAAYTRMTTLRTKYTAFRAHVDAELLSLGYLPSAVPTSLPSNTHPTSKHPPKLITTTPHKHKYGPTSPKYTVDKALKRKADKRANTPVAIRGAKRLKGDVESDYVETDCEEEKRGKVVVEEDTKSPPGAIAYAAAVELTEEEKRRMKEWSWRWAEVGRRGGWGGEVVVSPMGVVGVRDVW